MEDRWLPWPSVHWKCSATTLLHATKINSIFSLKRIFNLKTCGVVSFRHVNSHSLRCAPLLSHRSPLPHHRCDRSPLEPRFCPSSQSPSIPNSFSDRGQTWWGPSPIDARVLASLILSRSLHEVQASSNSCMWWPCHVQQIMFLRDSHKCPRLSVREAFPKPPLHEDFWTSQAMGMTHIFTGCFSILLYSLQFSLCISSWNIFIFSPQMCMILVCTHI